MLTPAEKQHLVDAMMIDANAIDEPHVQKEMAAYAWQQLRAMEPRLAEIVRNAEARGRFAEILEMLERRENKCSKQPSTTSGSVSL